MKHKIEQVHYLKREKKFTCLITKDHKLLDALNKSGLANEGYVTHNADHPIEHYNDAYWYFVTNPKQVINPVANLQPFIIDGPKDTLKILRELGLYTFEQYIDESYDNIADDSDRHAAVVELAIDLTLMSHERHVNLMYKAKPLLERNQSIFFNDPLFELLDHQL